MNIENELNELLNNFEDPFKIIISDYFDNIDNLTKAIFILTSQINTLEGEKLNKLISYIQNKAINNNQSIYNIIKKASQINDKINYEKFVSGVFTDNN